MKFNWFHFGIGFFFLGLQFTHMDVGPLQRFTLVPSVMKTWGWFLWSFFIVNVILVVKILLDVIKGYRESGCVVEYLIFIAAILGYAYWNTKRLGP